MRFLRKAGGSATFSGLAATVAAAAATGTSVTAISFGALSGGTWAISSNSFFTINSATGAVSTTATPTVAGTTYTPTVTFTYSGGGLSISATQALAILAAGAAPTPTPQPTTAVSEYNHVLTNTEARGGRTGRIDRWAHYLPRETIEVEFAFNAWRFPNSGAVVNASNDIPITAAYAEYSGVAIPLTFSGANTRRLAPGENDIRTQKLTPASFGFTGNFPAGSVIWTKVVVVMDVGLASMPNSPRSAADVSGQQTANFDPAVTTIGNISGAGAFTWTGTSPEQRALGFQPFCLGKLATAGKVYFAVGDSITQNVNDATANRSGRGWFQLSMGEMAAPSFNFGVSGMAADVNIGQSFVEYWMASANRGVIALGTNSFAQSGNGATVAAVQADIKELSDAMKAKGMLSVGVANLLVRITTTTQNLPEASQTPQPGWDVGGNADAYRTMAASDPTTFKANTGADYILPMNAIRGTSNARVWLQGSNNDDVHPNAAGHRLLRDEQRPLLTAA